MDSALLVPLALALGAVVGGGAVVAVIGAARRGRMAAEVASTSVPDGVDQVIQVLESAGVVLDPSNNVVSASPRAVTLGLVWNRTLVHARLVELVDRARRAGEPITEELELSRGPLGDAALHLSVRAARLGSRYMLLLVEDRTESYRLDAVRRDFVANISHELKTPIGAIGLLGEALGHAADDPVQVRRFAEQLSKESARLASLTQEIIELSRLQAKDALLHPDVVELDQVVAAAIDQNRVLADSRRVALVGGGQKGLRVWGDEAMLITAVHNLVHNAVQYSPSPSRVGIGVTATDDVIEIAVTDQGIGIPEDELDRVFERFFRVDQARSRTTGGTGLGLSIVKHVVQNHGGDVRVWSQPGRGSTFTIRLPRVLEPAPTLTKARS
ncbi:sensor histidine kinase [Microcella frigidaquae]|uniref:Sensor-like histidine kinase SenX3 n=1 Tax=Microcella frigidaquae TaxID=424758 RepID=A0A840XIV8_9MICO|nr:ATP-binding protein [Microcella frigidaquae]MBB5618412.1 two-component system sensor histidine kinase SenX3 [Microcella frigidaquae]NHN44685.1 two-component sensor histidine kinase [Microcella frigidaquae]